MEFPIAYHRFLGINQTDMDIVAKLLLIIVLWLAILAIRYLVYRRERRKKSEDDEIHWL